MREENNEQNEHARCCDGRIGPDAAGLQSGPERRTETAGCRRCRAEGATPGRTGEVDERGDRPIVGTWSLLIDDAVKDDGTHVPNFGPNPIGVAMFGADGHFTVAITRAGRAKFASNNRTSGTADENKAAVTGSNAFFGSYAVNEADKTLTLRVDGSTFPNLEGTTQKRTITSLTAGDELTWSNPANHGEVAWKWVK
jgi:hypothetical protein